jgi:hypothetical protein
MFFSNVQFATIYEKNVSYEIQPNERNFHSIIKRSTQNDYYMSEKKSGSDQLRFNLYVDYLVVTDATVYDDHKRFLNTNDQRLVFIHMKAYFAHYVARVNILKEID